LKHSEALLYFSPSRCSTRNKGLNHQMCACDPYLLFAKVFSTRCGGNAVVSLVGLGVPSGCQLRVWRCTLGKDELVFLGRNCIVCKHVDGAILFLIDCLLLGFYVGEVSTQKSSFF
jgi:hypothetical protein